MAGTPKSRASDFTGRQREAAAKEASEEQARRAEEISMATQAAEVALTNEVVDLAADPNGTVVLSTEEADEIETEEVEIKEQIVVVRVNEDLDMTFGDDRYEMKVGPKYRIPKHVADWLEERGVIWH